jgi:integrase
MPDYRLQRLNGRFAIAWEENGKRRRFRLVAASPTEARAAFQDFIREHNALTRPVERLTVKDIWSDYVAEKEAQERVSVSRMRDAWKSLAGDFGALDPRDITPALIRAYTAKRRKLGISDGTIHTELCYLRASLRFALRERAPDIRLPPKPRPRERHLTTDEARELINASHMPHVRLYILLALHTAGRPSSILDLAWNRVDPGKGTIQLDNPDRDRTAKGRATVPMAEELRQPLADARAAALTEYVIEWAGKPVASIKKGIARTAARAGLRGVTPYVLRHTAAVWMAEAGVPMSEISQYLGHTSTAVTERVYARYSPDHLRKASDAISRRLG